MQGTSSQDSRSDHSVKTGKRETEQGEDMVYAFV